MSPIIDAPTLSGDGESLATDASDNFLTSVRSGIVRYRWGAARFVLFVAMAVWLAVDQRDQLTTMVPGDPGDAFLIMTFLEWGGDRAVHLLRGYWDGPMFSSGQDVMAYSDTMLPLFVPFKLVATVTGSRVVAFNALFLSSWVLCAEFTYRLAVRLVRSRPAAVVAAVSFTFSTIRLAQTNHFQIAWACLIPLIILALFRFWDHPSPSRGFWLAMAVLCQFLTAAYYGVILLTFVVASLFTSAAFDLWRRRFRDHVGGYAAFGLALLVPMLLIQHQYASAASSTPARDGYPSSSVLSLGDLRSPAPTATIARSLGVFDTDTIARSSENYAYVGLVVITAIPLLLIAIGRRPSRSLELLQPVSEWVTVFALAGFGFVIAVGRGPILGIPMPFYDVARSVIPGVSSMVALVRLFAFTQLALSLLAGAAVAAMLRTLASRPARVAIAAVLVLAIGVEARTTHAMVRVIEPASGSVNEYMQSLDAGVVAILPVSDRSLGAIYAFTEAPRMLLGVDDDLQSFNGYSGYAPTGYESSAATINTFPSPEAIAELRRLGVTYVTILTSPADTGTPFISDVVNQSGFAYWPPDEVEQRLASLDQTQVQSIARLTDGLVITLAPASP